MAERSFAQAVSWLFHPLLMCTYGTLVYHFTFPSSYMLTPTSAVLMFAGVIFISTFIVPVVWTAIWMRMGYVKNLQMQDKADRRLPLLIVTVMYAAIFYVLQSKDRNVPEHVLTFLLGAVMAQTIALLLNLYIKISLHAIGVGGLTGMIFGFAFIRHEGTLLGFLFVTLLSGIVCSARLVLGAHRPREVYLGWIVGFAAEFGLIVLLGKLTMAV